LPAPVRPAAHEEHARIVAEELTAHDAFAAHVDAELNLDPDDLTNPWHAAVSSAIAFTLGALLPLLGGALAITGSVSAHLGGAGRRRATIRLVLGSALAMAVTYAVGQLLGAAV